MAEKRVHIIVSGRVQGVGFRFSVENWAKALGLNGWVKNMLNGEVEILAEGEENNVKKFIEKVRRGHPHANVENLHIDFEIPTGELWGFEIMY